MNAASVQPPARAHPARRSLSAVVFKYGVQGHYRYGTFVGAGGAAGEAVRGRGRTPLAGRCGWLLTLVSQIYATIALWGFGSIYGKLEDFFSVLRSVAGAVLRLGPHGCRAHPAVWPDAAQYRAGHRTPHCGPHAVQDRGTTAIGGWCTCHGLATPVLDSTHDARIAAGRRKASGAWAPTAPASCWV